MSSQTRDRINAALTVCAVIVLVLFLAGVIKP